MLQHDVVIVGGGPTGLMLAAELALGRVNVAVVERRPNQDLPDSRAGGLHARTIEVLDQRGVAERFLSQGQITQTTRFANAPLDISDFPTRHPYGLALWQKHIERILAEWVSELAVTFYRSTEVTSFVHDDAGVTVSLSDNRTMRAAYLVGCDGGRSLVRKQAGIELAGWDASTSYLIAECLMTDPVVGFRRTEKGTHALGPLDGGPRIRLVLEEPEVRHGDAPTLDELRAALVAGYGSDFAVRDVTWLSRFTDAARLAMSYRDRRVLLAGDAAHVHSPIGGQGLNLGVQDAVNLGWKLAQVVRGMSPDSLLDSYHAERHPVATRVLRTTLAQTALRRGDERTLILNDVVTDMLSLAEPRKRYAGMMSGLDIHYDLGAGHPLLGRRMPDLDVETDAGPQRVYMLLRAAQPLLLTFGEPFDLASQQVPQISARYSGPWELPVLGAVSPPSAVLVRPDGHVAWVGEGNDRGLRDALTTWFGAPS